MKQDMTKKVYLRMSVKDYWTANEDGRKKRRVIQKEC